MDKKILPGEPINEVEALQRLQQQEDPSQRCYAAWWLGRMRSQHPEVIPLLLKALEIKPTATEAAIAVARSAARSLGKLHAKTALAPLIQALLLAKVQPALCGQGPLQLHVAHWGRCLALLLVEAPLNRGDRRFGQELAPPKP